MKSIPTEERASLVRSAFQPDVAGVDRLDDQDSATLDEGEPTASQQADDRLDAEGADDVGKPAFDLGYNPSSRRAVFTARSTARSPIAEPVEMYAADHGLAFEKCEHGNQGWELICPHPDGGEHRLLLLYDDTLGLGVGAVWYFQCKEMDRIYYHWRQMAACPLDGDSVVAALDAERAALANVRFGYWTHMQPLKEPDPHAPSEPVAGSDGE